MISTTAVGLESSQARSPRSSLCFLSPDLGEL